MGGDGRRRGVKTPALGMITPLGLKTEYTVRHLPSSPAGGRGVKTPALGMITPLGLKTEYTVRHLPSSPAGVVTPSPLL